MNGTWWLQEQLLGVLVLFAWGAFLYRVGRPHLRMIVHHGQRQAGDPPQEGDFAGPLRPDQERYRISVQNQDGVPVEPFQIQVRVLDGTARRVSVVGGVGPYTPGVMPIAWGTLFLVRAPAGLRAHATWVVALDVEPGAGLEITLGQEAPLTVGSAGTEREYGAPVHAGAWASMGACTAIAIVGFLVLFRFSGKPAEGFETFAIVGGLLLTAWSLLAWSLTRTPAAPVIQGYLGWGRKPREWTSDLPSAGP